MASSSAASSCCSRLGLTKTVSRAMPPGKVLCKCCRGLAMPCLVTESYLQLTHCGKSWHTLRLWRRQRAWSLCRTNKGSKASLCTLLGAVDPSQALPCLLLLLTIRLAMLPAVDTGFLVFAGIQRIRVEQKL